MIILDSAAKSIAIMLAANVRTNQLPFVCTAVDLNSTAFIPVSTDGTTDNTNPVTAAAAPASGYSRQLKFLSVYNADTAAATVYVQLTDGSNTRIVFTATLLQGYKLIFAQNEFAVYDTNGAKQGTGTAGATGPAGTPGTDYWLYVTNN